jgi:methyl-accepting chemotaxis protein
VVADEVRNLARRTQDSTEQINKILNLLVSRIKEVTVSMDQSVVSIAGFTPAASASA